MSTTLPQMPTCLVGSYNWHASDWLAHERRITAYWESRCRRAVKRLKGAREEVEHWGGYASEYFKDKWNLAGDLKATDDVLAAIGPLPDQEPK